MTSRRLAAETGSGPVSAIFGVAVFLGFLLFSVQVMLHLWASSAVTTAAFDAARLVAGERPFTPAEAEDHLRGLLGAYGERLDEPQWEVATASIVLRVSAPTPAPLIASVGRLAGLDRIERTIHVRREVPR